MVTSQQATAKFGAPQTNEAKHMVLYDVPERLEIATLPNRVYCNKLLVKPLELALTNIVARGLVAEVLTWDGCFQIRKKRGANSMSLHAWGLAVDLNQAQNPFGAKPKMPRELILCFTDTGLWDWGGNWKKPDGMHFQLKSLERP